MNKTLPISVQSTGLMTGMFLRLVGNIKLFRSTKLDLDPFGRVIY